MPKDYYQTLGVGKSATADDIKRAYRKQAMQHHPDRAGHGSTAKFKEINEAYQVLSDPQKRAAYDQFGHAGVGAGGPSGFGGYGGFPRGQAGSYDTGGVGFDFSGIGGLGSIFEEMFAGAFSTVQAEIAITPAQAVLGSVVHLQNQQREKLTLKIPPGTQDGSQFKFRGKGQPTRRGRGDLIVTVRVQIPRRVSREQRRLYEELLNSET